ncbi:MAG: hypothetical protein K2R98_16650 [Gemmataceae bacterium]|nr:hypothetical protein [Gemmataceae bacterium]
MTMHRSLLLGLSVLLATAGCAGSGNNPGSEPSPPGVSVDDKIKNNLDKLDPKDRDAALAQRFCAVESDHRLGSMGVPVKIAVKDKEVFICCKACVKKAHADPEATLKKAEQLNEDTEVELNLAQLNAEDRKLALAQRFCATDGESRLGSMGPPPKIAIQGQPVFLCCGGCEKAAREDEKKTLTRVKDMIDKNTKK